MNTNFTPAFPTWVNDDSMMPGMTLRDYFAAAALQAFLTINVKEWNSMYGKNRPENFGSMALAVPNICYKFADAMMEARK